MKKNLVVVGYGGMGGWHTQHALKSDCVNLAGVYDILPEKNELARSRGIFAYDSLEAVLADPKVDLITIAVPNDFHKEIAVAALNAGKNVISEKPVTLSSADLKEMIAAANANNRVFSVHQNRRWDVDFLAMKKIYDSGEIGEMFTIESRIHGSRGIPSDWRGEKEHGGGMLYDWGVHLVDQILQIIKEDIKTIYCRFEHLTNDEVDDGFKLVITFESGKEAYVEVGTYNFVAMPRFYMRAKKGSAIITDWREKCKIVKCKAWHESEVIPVQTAAGLTKTMAPRDSVTVDEYEIERPESDVHDYYRNFCKAIDGEATQLVTHEEMMKVMRVMEESFRSVELGQVVEFKL
ncbi:MAG: Gfo/Idh/MocA family oxidoreductase [Ruminococcaceae bacterium]|nr:Gfo/Idh/MocA family oxidoreductase [Oscillospiraceae bacterium]MBQ4048305.1 Gfo/Idh/MocA family oxidoreductase [Clostridia bacterium]